MITDHSEELEVRTFIQVIRFFIFNRVTLCQDRE